jgi:dTDP-4-amino-4,6-dideoxygalactose transaminase
LKVTPARVVFSAADRAEVARAVDEALSTGSLTLGAATRRFEEAFAARHQSPQAVAVASGTAALEIILRAIGVAGRDVVVPANTFFATAAAVVHAGGRPVLADVEPDTMTLSAESLRAALTADTAAVIHVHIGGLIAPTVLAVAEVCREAGVPLVEDAAHAHGSSLGGRHAGAFGDQGKAGFLGNVHVRDGYAWRMSEVHAAIGEVHLRRLDDFLAHRARIAARYDDGLRSTPLTLLPTPTDAVNNFYKYIAFLPPGVDRAAVKTTLREQHEVGLSGEVYELPLQAQPVYEHLAGPGLNISEDVCARHICLPLHSDMTDAEADLVVDSLATVLAEMIP